MHKRSLLHQLFEIEAVRFGSFPLKSGLISPIYIDLRRAFSFPKTLVAMAEALFAKVHTQKFDLICAVPYAAIPLATAISIQHTIPLILLRKELKNYGTKQRIEGVFQNGQKVLLVEDVITLGESVLSAIDYLEAAGLVVEDVAIFTDREQGAMENIASEGYRPHAVCTLTELVQSLLEEKRIDQAGADRVFAFVRKMRHTL